MADRLGHVNKSGNEATKIQRALRHATRTTSIRRRCDLIESCPSFTRLPHNSLLFIQFDQLGASLCLLSKCEVNQRHLSQRRQFLQELVWFKRQRNCQSGHSAKQECRFHALAWVAARSGMPTG